MSGRRVVVIGAVSLAVVAAGAGWPAAAQRGPTGGAGGCGPGAHTLSTYRQHVYPETGNGGYRSLHTDVHLVYDAVANRFLAGNHVVLSERATKCLTSFSLDFERHSTFAGGPDMSVGAVLVNGRPARFAFAQPTYPGDPNGQHDPDPRAHQAGQNAVVGGPAHNPLPPACSPQLPPDASADAADGTPCPANKLVITPPRHLKAGADFTVSVFYTGRPGVHEDGDGTTEGWFRSDVPAGDGGFVTTEPVGSEDWMPLNDHPSAKPTYDFYDTVTAGRTAIANGILVGTRHNAPSTQFPGGSTSWHWHMGSPVASYLVENSVGAYDLTERTVNGIRFYEAQASSLSAARKQANLAIMNQQPDITAFQSTFNGAYPFASAGVVVGRPEAGFEEEMEGMITFAGGSIDLDTLNHENMHQWWGDHVTEANYNLTFFKEGLATFGEFLFAARQAADAAGGLTTRAGLAAFNHSLIHQFNVGYGKDGLWLGVPSDPTPYTLFSGSSTYTRPGLAYIALRQILGAARFDEALQAIQHAYGNATITEPELETAFARWLPNPSRACQYRLQQFFTQWFDTAYPNRAGAAKPTITGPGLDGGGFSQPGGSC
jgi:Peptidase family M1 domain